MRKGSTWPVHLLNIFSEFVVIQKQHKAHIECLVLLLYDGYVRVLR